ncbi:hypothetical protein HDU93_005116, partial [Gonapodya sp. JEL0774]
MPEFPKTDAKFQAVKANANVNPTTTVVQVSDDSIETTGPPAWAEKEKLANETDVDYDETNFRHPDIVLGRRPLAERLWEVTVNWLPLGYVTFGGPGAHVALMLQLWVHNDNKKWLDPNSFAELFSICQSLPGPASTKLQFAIAIIRTGLVPALYAFLLWCMPGFLIMLGIAYGINAIGNSIPVWLAYIENGLVSVAVGLVALAAYKLAKSM